jgi:myo-inositol-1(or 4)-monophosphatase
MYNKELQVTKQAAREAGEFLQKEFLRWKRGNAKYKEHMELVTWVDKKAEKIILTKLKKYFPDYAILSEESGLQDKPSDYSWVVDPLDGTTNFTIHHPLFATSISLFYKNEVVVAVSYLPILKEMYWASQGNGAYKGSEKIKVSSKSSLRESIVSYNHGQGRANTGKSFKIFEHFQNKALKCYDFHCTSMQTAMVAAGHIDAYMVSGAKLWDVAAGMLFIKEAGGIVTDWKNKPWTKNSKTIVATNKTMHKIYLRELKKLKLA